MTRAPRNPPHQLPLLQPIRPGGSPVVLREDVVTVLADLLREALGEPRPHQAPRHGGGDESEDHG